MAEIEPHAYGDHFKSVEELQKAVTDRINGSKTTYGMAIIYRQKEDGLERIGARVGHNGDIMVGAHCEWI